jgi:hypothetical protein
MELWTPPHDAPHLLEWWRPLMLVAQRVRADRVPWPIHMDQFRLFGRVIRQNGRPHVWVYEHHESRRTIHTDATGVTYKFIPTPRGRGPGMFKPCDIRIAVYRAGLPDVVEPIWYEPPKGGWDEYWYEDDEDDGSEAANEPPGRQHGHLTVIGGHG